MSSTRHMSDLLRYTSFPDEPAEFDNAEEELEALRKQVATAQDEGAQAQFEKDVKDVCWMCGSGNTPFLHNSGDPVYIHRPTYEFGRCKAEAIRLANPERSERMNAAVK